MRSTLGVLVAPALAGILLAVPAGAQMQNAAGVESAGSAAAPSDCCSAEAMRRFAASAGSLDMVGIKLGMTIEQTIAAMKAYNPAMQVEVLNGRLQHPAAANFVRTPMYVSAYTRRAPNAVYETITAALTTPPNAPVVYQISRYVQFPAAQVVRASNMVDSLTKKYGASNFYQSTRGMAWIYDQSGKLVTQVGRNQGNCIAAGGDLPVGNGDPDLTIQLSLENTVDSLSGNELMTPDCQAVNFVTAWPLGGVAPDQSLVQVRMTIASGALWYGSRKRTHDWLQAEADGAKKRADEAAAQQQGPRL